MQDMTVREDLNVAWCRHLPRFDTQANLHNFTACCSR